MFKLCARGGGQIFKNFPSAGGGGNTVNRRTFNNYAHLENSYLKYALDRPEIVFEYSVRASVVAEKLMEHCL